MRRAYWPADFADANTAAGLLRAKGIGAFVFDVGMAQLNWLDTPAIGGYRIKVAVADFPAAQDLLRVRHEGDMRIPEAESDRRASCANVQPAQVESFDALSRAAKAAEKASPLLQ